MPKISVIVPVYGVEQYIERCAISLFEQTLDDIEFIFVNDCTNDKSIEVLNSVLHRYPNRAPQVKIITHENNLGQAQTRRTGIMSATGNYLIHCDSDDWVDVNLYEMMYLSAISNDSDIVVCDFHVHKENSVDLRLGTRANDVNEFIENLLFQKDPVSLCNKLINRRLYDNSIRFPVENMGEDMAIVLQLMEYCHSISYVRNVYYHYDGMTISITRKTTKEAALSRALQACHNVNIAIRPYLNSHNDIIQDGIIHLKFMQRRLLMPIINYRDVYKVWQRTFPEINKKVLFKMSIGINLIDRIKFFLTLVGIFPLIKEYTRKNLS